MQTLTFNDLPEVVANLAIQIESLKKAIDDKLEPAQTEPKDEIMTVEQVSTFLGLAIPTIYSKTSRNKIPHMKKGKKLYFSKLEILEYLRDGKRKSRSEIENEAHRYIVRK